MVICGGGIAELTAAWWLDHHGAEVVVVERAPGLRGGGYLIDFLGQTFFDALDGRVALRFGHSVARLVHDRAGSRITAKLDDGTREHADLLVGADGIHSRVRQLGYHTAAYVFDDAACPPGAAGGRRWSGRLPGGVVAGRPGRLAGDGWSYVLA